MKNKICLFIIMTLISNKLLSQSFSKNSIYYDAFGHTRSLYSLNYERSIFQIYNKIHLNGRIGIGYYKYSTNADIVTDIATIIPAVGLIEYGSKSHFVNLGIGYSASFIKKKMDSEIPNFDFAFSYSIGYKYMDIDGLFIQIYPVIIQPKISEREMSGGISLGFSW